MSDRHINMRLGCTYAGEENSIAGLEVEHGFGEGASESLDHTDLYGVLLGLRVVAAGQEGEGGGQNRGAE